MTPDYLVWDTYDEFTAHQAAYLWLDKEPELDPEKTAGDAFAVLQAIYDAVERREITSGIRDTRAMYAAKGWADPYEHKIVTIDVEYWTGRLVLSRIALRKWAEKTRQRPLFLFQEDRIKPIVKKDSDEKRNIPQKPITDHKADNLRKIIGLAALALVSSQKGTKRLGTAENPTIDALAELISSQGDIMLDAKNVASIRGTSVSTVTDEIKRGLKLLGIKD
ncbi:hypothetical protein [uncultured Thiodictyon sp.]|uniref:hypothetical protein n=1 Tax=uncultured Thiodictyon sp. TaxID=1846217 RepID=UPI0025F8D906|nr:hypothetical protein [uncultured Thiodictyon sp.]